MRDTQSWEEGMAGLALARGRKADLLLCRDSVARYRKRKSETRRQGYPFAAQPGAVLIGPSRVREAQSWEEGMAGLARPVAGKRTVRFAATGVARYRKGRGCRML